MVCPKCGKEINENTKFCDSCGEEIIQPPVVPKKKSKKKLIAVIAVLVAVIILVVSLASSGSGGLTVESDNDTGAVLNLTRDELNAKINQAIDDIGEYSGQGENDFEIDSYWSNKVPPQVDNEELSGKEFTIYSAVIDNVIVTATVEDEKIASVNSGFEYSEYEMGDYFGVVLVMACSDLGVEEASNIIDTIANNELESSNTMIYKDGILYDLLSTGSTMVSWHILAADNDFVESLESSGNCNVLRW